MKYTLSFLFSLTFLLAFSQNPTSIDVDVKTPEIESFVPYSQVHFTYQKKGAKKLKSERTMRWDNKKGLWNNYSTWKRGVSKEQSESGMIVERYNKNRKKYTQKNAKLDQTFMFRLSEEYFEKYNSIYTRRPDGKILTVSYDRCSSNVRYSFKYNYKGNMESYELVQTSQYGKETISKGTFHYPVISIPVAQTVQPPSLELEVFPNPSSGLINIRFDRAPESSVKLTIESLSGERLEKVHFNKGSKIIPVDLSNYVSGMYIVKCIADGQQTLHKVFITN